MYANEAHYSALVWGLALTTAICAYLFLRGTPLTFVSLLILITLTISFLVFSRKRKARKIVFAYNRHGTTILADVIMESLKISLFSLLLDSAIQGATYQAIIGDFSDQWGLTRIGCLICLMFAGYLWCVALGYPPAARDERRRYARDYELDESDVN